MYTRETVGAVNTLKTTPFHSAPPPPSPCTKDTPEPTGYVYASVTYSIK